MGSATDRGTDAGTDGGNAAQTTKGHASWTCAIKGSAIRGRHVIGICKLAFSLLSLSLSPCRPQPPIPFLSLPSNLKLNQLVFVASSVVVIVVIFVVGLFFSFFSFHFVGLSAV